MKQRIESEMRSGKAKVVEFWEAVLKCIHVYIAKARLKEVHAGKDRAELDQRRDAEAAEQQRRMKEDNTELEALSI